MNILVTGSAGKTAQPIIELLREKGHSITLFDIADGGDVRDIHAVNCAMQGMDAVIHLAVNTSDTNDDRLSFETNVYGTYNLLRCAQKNHVKKTMIACSAPVHTAGVLCNPGEDFAYDLTKCLQEEMALRFSQSFGMSIMALRLGHIVDGKRQTDLHGNPLSELTYCRGGWVCRHDVARAFAQAIDTDFTGYCLSNVIGSYQAASHFDLSGFECAERFLAYA